MTLPSGSGAAASLAPRTKTSVPRRTSAGAGPAGGPLSIAPRRP
ncbi:hypothetical protein QA634_05985 [Methylobacterium sp. CB376]|nr:hypothetical protein [Methylobacterium nodulans]WFT81437.1 hypothetical protein QA634_05985 [Methylobacterium nodulans]